MFINFKSYKIANYFSHIINNGKIDLSDYYQKLYNKEVYPYVYHTKMLQISILISGKGYVILNNKKIRIGKGSIIIFDNNTIHSFKSLSKYMEFIHIHIPNNDNSYDRIVVK